ncbi:2-succinyl-6-hydroxy-2,4-cyclohexadiene-1-carboxylate synthase [Pendulispora rubella]|uniref:2-succinyl-6-hydroxy-2,4-cyclohexadiene-1-carboxylate synthase n=1 Tax=Pendulispora rubella TaxID=2741070 RepID=A0ABZ2KW84_9BACT
MSSRAPLLLLHGFAGGPFAWDRVVTSLHPDRRVLRPALLGHDVESTAALGAAGFEGEVERMAELVRQADWQDVHVCGYSLGGRVALGLLVQHPELFARATVIGAHPGLATERERSERLASDARWIALLRQRGCEAFLEAWEAQPLFASQQRLPEELRDAQRAARRLHSVNGLASAMDHLGLARMPNYGERLGEIRIPVTLMVGEEDTKFRAVAGDMASRMADVRLEIVPGAGHNVVLENPAAVARVLE